MWWELTALRSKGVLKTWDDVKGYGFIETFHDRQRVFVHIKALDRRLRRPVVGDVITFTLANDARGRSNATDAQIAGVRPAPGRKPRTGHSGIVLVAFIVALGLGVATSVIPGLVAAYYLAVSLITLLLYAVDKSAARNGSWRTPESQLHLCALLGGWPGALLGQMLLRHKSSKKAFRSVFWMTVVLNSAGLLWLCSPAGTPVMQALLSMAGSLQP
jgi:uncharacterized membrane protein YsdA (DUF1294 family)/cold shock CspA family protein